MNRNHTSEPFAIVGLSCLFPGATTPDEFWQNLIHGVNSISPTTEEQFGVDPAVYFDPQRLKQDTTYSLRGGYVRAKIDIPAGMDKASGWTLYVAQEALRDSGVWKRHEVLARCGLILGNLSFPTQESHMRVAPLYDAALETAVGELLGVPDFQLQRPRGVGNRTLTPPAAVVAQNLGLGGAAFCIDAACASSLYAVSLACEYLATGKADLMLAGAVSAADPLFVNMGFTHFGAYPDAGESRPLDSESEGLISGEGAGLLVLKRYADALRDGDKIYALVSGVGLSNDGRGKHPLTPNRRGQVLAIQRAYAGGIDPRTVQYVECHASGTPLGDKTELSSMDEFFGGVGAAPMIGAVKANHGHLLTVAGLSSMLKVILSMQHGQIPATMRVENPLTLKAFGAAKIVSQNTIWSQREKVAGVNAFGFGGVSAHVVLQNEAAFMTQATVRGTVKPQDSRVRMAIIGMDAQFGGCDGLEAYSQTVYDGKQHFVPLPAKRWKGLSEDAPVGAYIESFEIDFLRFKFPPKEDDQPTPQHLLLLKVADNAVRDARLQEGENVVVIVALGTELSLHQYRSRLDLSWQIEDSLRQAGIQLADDGANSQDLTDVVKNAISPTGQVNQYTSYIGNIVSSRVSSLWNFSGPAFTLSALENSVMKALEVAGLLLRDDAIDAVVLGAVDLAGGIENVLLRREDTPINSGTATLSFDQNANGWQVGEGAGAVVLRRADRAHGQGVYATLESVTIVPGTDAAAVATAAQSALDAAGVRAEQVGLMEVAASGSADQDTAEIVGLNQVYGGVHSAPLESALTAIGSAAANIGNTGAASGMASLIKAALCLHRRFIPATPHWTAPKLPEVWQKNVFYVAPTSRTWFRTGAQARYASLSGISAEGASTHVILSDNDVIRQQTIHTSSYLRDQAFRLFPISANDGDELIRRLDWLENALNAGESLASLARQAFAAFGQNKPYALALVGRDQAALLREIQLARKGVPAAFERSEEWLTPAGSCFAPHPLGTSNGITFIYPGAFNSYPEVGRDWLHLFPSAHDHLETLTTDLSARSAEHYIYSRWLKVPSRPEVRAFRSRLTQNQTAMMESGTMLSVLYTHVLRDLFKVEPDSSFGYSQGEGTMFWAMSVWRDSDGASAALKDSDLFTRRLFGRKDTIRRAWGLGDDVPDNFWVSYVLSSTPLEVSAQIAVESHVFLTHINTPHEVVIAGDPTVCQRIIDRLGCPSVLAPFDVVTHNEIMMADFEEFCKLYRSPLHDFEQNVTFYSAADYEPLRLESDLIARSIARVSCKQIDFPRLIDRAHRDGSRVFIELGPGSTCTRWIGDTLSVDKREYLSVAIDNLRLDDHTALVKLLARLVSHHVPVDLALLYGDDPQAQIVKQLLRTITLGGEPVRDVILSAENRQRFGDAARPAATPIERIPQRSAAPLPVGASDHSIMLNSRTAGLQALGAALFAQLHGAAHGGGTQAPVVAARAPAIPVRGQLPVPTTRYVGRPAIFDTATIDQFARGSIKACFGPEYAVYDDRRAPRIPNSDLMLLSRIVEVNATRLDTKVGSNMVAEYDVPAEIWFYRDNPYPFTPYSMLMEIALQPCGFLSAFMGPTLAFPEIDFYFRNLDGQGKLTRPVDLRGKTLVNRVTLVSSTVLQGIIIQKYTFDLSLDGEQFYVGSSTFGYFTLASFASQAGLDRGNPPAKWHEANTSASIVRLSGNRQAQSSDDVFGETFMALPTAQLAFLDEALVDVQGGKAGLGYIYSTTKVDPSDWFLSCHFHEDPVMPGSLGLEAIMQSIQLYALRAGVGASFAVPHFENSPGEMIWKYRGQVLGDSGAVQVEVHITKVEPIGDRVQITADASLWKGALRIYEFKNATVSVMETDFR